MILIVSFPGMSSLYIDFSKLMKVIDEELDNKLKAMTAARAEIVASIRPELPCNQIIKAIETYIPFLIELGPILSMAKSKSPMFSWITAILTSEEKIISNGSSN